jgi:two-component system, response regulator
MDDDRQTRILLIDDSPTDVEVTLGALHMQGLATAVRIARGGQEALDYLFGRGQFANRRRFPLPDLILLDLTMPAVDGYEVLRLIKCDECLRAIPVIILCISEHEVSRAMERGPRANDYLVKPVSVESFRDLVQHIRNWSLRLDLPTSSAFRIDGRGSLQ